MQKQQIQQQNPQPQQHSAPGHGHGVHGGAAVAPPSRARGSASPASVSDADGAASSPVAAAASVPFGSLPAWPQTHLLQHLQQQQQQQQQQGQGVDGQLQSHLYLQHALHLAQRAIQTQQHAPKPPGSGRPPDMVAANNLKFMQLQSAMAAAQNDRDRVLAQHQLSRNDGKAPGIVQHGSLQGNQSQTQNQQPQPQQQRVPNSMAFLFGQNSQMMMNSPGQARSVEPASRNSPQQYPFPPEMLPQLQARMLAMQQQKASVESPHLRLGPQSVPAASANASDSDPPSSNGTGADLLGNIHAPAPPSEFSQQQQAPHPGIVPTLSMTASKPDVPIGRNPQMGFQMPPRPQQQFLQRPVPDATANQVGGFSAAPMVQQNAMVPIQTPAGTGGANDSSVVQQNVKTVGFTRQQLMVLRAQILAFRRLKRGDRSFTVDMIRAITPAPLPMPQSQAPVVPVVPAPSETNQPPKVALGFQEPPAAAADDKATHRESSAKSSDGGPELEVGRKSTPAQQASPPVDAPKAVTTSSIPDVPVPTKSIVTTEEENSTENNSNDSATQPPNLNASLSVLSSRVPSKTQTGRRYRGPLFDFPPFGKKPDTGLLPTNANANATNVWGPPVSLGYDVGELLFQEGVRIIGKKKAKKLKIIEMLLSNDSLNVPSDLKLKLRIEQRKLVLLKLQGKIRNDVEEHQKEIMAMGDRAYRKFVRLCERQRMELARQVTVQQKTTKEKYLKSILQWRKKLLEAHWSARDARINRNRGIAKFHERLLRDYSKRKDEDRSKRMEALKNNDVDAYREMLIKQQKEIPGDAEQRFEVLESFLSQTEDYLHKLGGKISAVKTQQEREEAALAAAASARAQGFSEEEVERAAALASKAVPLRSWNGATVNSVNKYYTLAHAVNEQILRQPSMLRAGVLRDYQLVGLQWMLSLYNNRLNGILADEMGLGKTVQVMALIAYLMEFKGNYGPHLIIVPNAVIVNWKSELLRWLPSVSCIFYVGVREDRSRIYSQEVAALKFNVLVTTYEYIMRDRSKLAKIDWKYIIIDEAQRMKDRESRLARDLDRFRCQRRLLLTGTPLQNDLHELWSLLNLLLPEVFDNSKAFHDWFSKPFQRDANTVEDDWLETEKKVIVIHRLHQILEPFMLRRRVEDVEGSLPPKVPVVLKCKMSAYQAAIYDWVKATGTIRLDPADEEERVAGNGKRQIRAFAPLQNKCMELRKVCNHPYLNYPPQCRLFNENMVRMCGKLWILDRILIKLQKTGHRVLLFSTMTKLLDILEDYLQWRGLIYRRIDGTTPLDSRENAIVDFNAPGSQCFIFLLSIRAAGRGLNLQTADTVVIYDPDPNPKNEEQAVARAHRIGQKSEVKVIYMEAVVETITSYQKEDELRNGGSLDVDDEMAGKDRYMGSVESLVRNNIQQHKIDMADEVINAGRFDQRTTHEERRMTLEALLHDEERYQESMHDVPTLKEVNRMIARNEEEVELFDQMDEECEWPGEMVGYDEVPEWLHVGSDEVNGAIKATSKQALVKGMSGISGIIGTKAEEDRLLAKKASSKKGYAVTPVRKPGRPAKRGRPPFEVQKAASRIEIEEEEDLEEGGVEEESSSGEDEEDGEIREGSEEEEELEAKDVAKDEGEEVDEEVEIAESSEEREEESPEARPEVHTVDSKKFGSLAELGNRSQQELGEDLEEGEIAASGDSRADSPPSENWGQEQEGDEDQVLEPRRKRKRSARHRRKIGVGNVAVQGAFPISYLQPWPGYPAAVPTAEVWGINPRPAAPAPPVAATTTFIHTGFANWSSQASQNASKQQQQNKSNAFQEQAEEVEMRDNSNNRGVARGGARMQESVQKKCKAVLSKLQGAMNKDGRQVSALLMELPRHNELPDYYKVIDKPIDAKTIEEHLDRFDYATVLDFAGDVQLMLDNASRYNTNNAEVQADARRLHSLFFQRMGLMFPDVDFNSIKINIGIRLSGSRSSRKQRQVFAEAGKLAAPPAAQPSAHPEKEEVRGKDHRKSKKGGAAADRDRLETEVFHPADLVICKKRRNSRRRPRTKGSSNKRKRGSSSGGLHQSVAGLEHHHHSSRKVESREKSIKGMVDDGGPLSWTRARKVFQVVTGGNTGAPGHRERDTSGRDSRDKDGVDEPPSSTLLQHPRKKSRTDSGRRRPGGARS